MTSLRQGNRKLLTSSPRWNSHNSHALPPPLDQWGRGAGLRVRGVVRARVTSSSGGPGSEGMLGVRQGGSGLRRGSSRCHFLGMMSPPPHRKCGVTDSHVGPASAGSSRNHGPESYGRQTGSWGSWRLWEVSHWAGGGTSARLAIRGPGWDFRELTRSSHRLGFGVIESRGAHDIMNFFPLSRNPEQSVQILEVPPPRGD